MIQCLLPDAARLRGLSPEFACAIDWLLAHRPENIAPGSYLIGSGVKVNCEEPRLRPTAEALLEAHVRYADIHVPIAGPEQVGLAYTSTLSHPTSPYDAERDIRFYTDQYSTVTTVNPGEILIVFPEDAHAPNIGCGPHRKLCIKIPII